MILIFLALIIIFVAGLSISRFFLGNKLSAIQTLTASMVIGFVFMGYFILFAALLTGSLETGVYLFMSAGGLWVLYFAIKNFGFLNKTLRSDNFNQKTVWERVKKISWLEIVFVSLFIVFFLDIFFKTIVFDNGSYKVAAAGYGDIPYHMTQVSHFINNKPFSLDDPTFLGSKLNYPFLINLLSSSFYVLSHNYIFSFNLPSLILNLSGITLLYSLISKFIRSISARVCTFLIFLLGSGLEFVRILKDDSFWAKDSIAGMADYVLHLPYPIANIYNAVYPGQNNIWSDFITMFLMHQRTFFFGFASGVLGLFILFLASRSNEKKIFYFYGIFIGSLPLVHIHTFIALLIVTLGFFIWALIDKERALAKNLFYSIVVSLGVSAFLVYRFIIFQAVGKSFLVLRLGWMSESGGIGSVLYNPLREMRLQDWGSYMWHNFGVFIPLFIIALAYIAIKRKALREQGGKMVYPVIFSAFLLFIAVNTIKFQPWDFDTGKIFAYFLLLGSITIGVFFDQWKSRLAKALMVAVISPIIAGGLVDTFSRSSYADPPLYEIFSRQDQEIADWIVKNTRSSGVILTGSSHLNPVDSLAGRPVLVGYGGWLWSHGVDYGERENDIRKIYAGGSGAEGFIEKYGIEYIMISSKERRDYRANESFFDSAYPVVFQSGDTKIYKIESKP